MLNAGDLCPYFLPMCEVSPGSNIFRLGALVCWRNLVLFGSSISEHHLRSMHTFCWSGANVKAFRYLVENCGVQVQRGQDLFILYRNVPAVLGLAMAL